MPPIKKLAPQTAVTSVGGQSIAIRRDLADELPQIRAPRKNCDVTRGASSTGPLGLTLRFNNNSANLTASLNGLMRRGGFTKREARSHR